MLKSAIRSILAFSVLLVVNAQSALAAKDQILEGAKDARGSNGSLVDSLSGKNGGFALISNILIYITGAIAVIMIIIGGLRYVISQGSNEQVKQAKDTILYGVIGMVVAILAYAIVSFVTHNLK